MRWLIGLAFLLASFVAEAQVWQTVFGPQTVTIRRNTQEYGPAPIDPATTTIAVYLSRENWPAAGVDIQLLVSFDNGQTWEGAGFSHIPPHIPDPKEPTPTPASITVGWNQEIRQATHAKAITVNPSGNFQSVVRIDAFVVQ